MFIFHQAIALLALLIILPAPAGSAMSAGTGVAGVVDKSGHFILFR
jgi:hypothetical protein